MSNVNEIVFNVHEYDDDVDDMLYDVKDVMKILVKNNYEMSFRYDDCGFYVLEYASDNDELGGPRVRWLDAEQFDELLNILYDECEEARI